MDFMMENMQSVWGIASSLMSVACMVTALTPTPKDDAVLSIVRKLADVLALNVGHAANK